MMDKQQTEAHQIPDLDILKVFNKMPRASLLYLETNLRQSIKKAKNGSDDTDRDFLKKELERLRQRNLIGEIESHSDTLRAYYLKADGIEQYCYLKEKEDEIMGNSQLAVAT